MKRSKLFLSLALVCTLSFGQRQTTVEEVSVESATATSIEEFNPGVRIFPFLVDYEMVPKNNPEAKRYVFETNKRVSEIVKDADSWIYLYTEVAKAKMMEEYNCDAILSATSSATTKNGRLVITVRGYPVKYTNFRKATKDDLWILEFEKRDLNIYRHGSEERYRIDSRTHETVHK